MYDRVEIAPTEQVAQFGRRLWYGSSPPTVSFSEVIEAHTALVRYLRRHRPAPAADDDQAGGDPCAPDAGERCLRHDYKQKLAAFIGRGSLDEVYWGKDGESGVAVTLSGPRFKRRARLHRVSDFSTGHAPKITGAILKWDTLAVRAETLTGKSAQVSMRWIFGSVSYLLGVALSGDAEADEKEILKQHSDSLQQATAYYVENARRGAYLAYFWGMCFGALANGGLAFGFVALLHWGVPHLWGFDVSNTDQGYAVAAAVAGAMGTILSVLLRMTRGGFGISYEIGWSRLFFIGSFRPYIGAVSGLAVYFALRANLLTSTKNASDTFALFVFLAFLSGFSERFARDTFLGVAKTVTPIAATDGAKDDGT